MIWYYMIRCDSLWIGKKNVRLRSIIMHFLSLFLSLSFTLSLCLSLSLSLSLSLVPSYRPSIVIHEEGEDFNSDCSRSFLSHPPSFKQKVVRTCTYSTIRTTFHLWNRQISILKIFFKLDCSRFLIICTKHFSLIVDLLSIITCARTISVNYVRTARVSYLPYTIFWFLHHEL